MNTSALSYLMEDPREAQRLAAKVNAPGWVQDYLASHCATAKRALDVGCGPGTISAELAKRFPATQVVALDISPARLAEASQQFIPFPNATTQYGEATNLPFTNDSFGFVYCRFLLEYLPNREQAIAEMARVCEPGGTVLLQDLDGQLLWHFPHDPQLEQDIDRVISVLAQSGFDPFVGRKLFAFAKQAGLSELTVQIEPYHLIAGVPTAHDLALWELKLVIALPAMAHALGGAAAAKGLKSRFIDYLRREDSLTYSVLFTVTAKKNV